MLQITWRAAAITTGLIAWNIRRFLARQLPSHVRHFCSQCAHWLASTSLNFIWSYFIFLCALKQCSNIPLLLLHTTIPSKNIQYTLYQSYVNGQWKKNIRPPEQSTEEQSLKRNICCNYVRCYMYSNLVSGCLKPSQPQRIISGPKETFVKRYRTKKAEIRPEEQNEKAESCQKNLWN